MKIFGYEITSNPIVPSEKSIVTPNDDGAIDITLPNRYTVGADDLGSVRTETELIKNYRDLSMMADVDNAVEDIINACVANIDDEPPVKLDVDKIDLSDSIKKKLQDEFTYLLNLLDFDVRAHELIHRWYVDGRISFHKVIDTKDVKRGIVDIRYIDPRKIKKIREVLKKKESDGSELVIGTNEYFLYNPNGFSTTPGGGSPVIATRAQGTKITKDSIAYAPSGLFDANNNMVIGYLQKAIKPANNLRMMENSMVIYRLVRAPERRIFYIDVGTLPNNKASQYIKSIMNQYRNKMIYDVTTGEVRDDKRFMSMLDDFWLARREGGRGTQIDTLPASQSTGIMEEVTYLQHKLYEALHVPISRLESQGGLNFGKQSEITRDELKFIKFINKLQKRFSVLFYDLLKTQCILKNILTSADWDKIKHKIKFKFAQDAYYAESKNQEILNARFELMGMAVQYQGEYVSKEWIWKEILKLTDLEIDQMQAQMKTDPQNPLAMSPAGNGVPIDDEGDPLGMKKDAAGPNGKPAKTGVTVPKKKPKDS